MLVQLRRLFPTSDKGGILRPIHFVRISESAGLRPCPSQLSFGAWGLLARVCGFLNCVAQHGTSCKPAAKEWPSAIESQYKPQQTSGLSKKPAVIRILVASIHEGAQNTSPSIFILLVGPFKKGPLISGDYQIRPSPKLT